VLPRKSPPRSLGIAGRSVMAASALSFSLGAPAAELHADAVGMQQEIVLTQYSPLSRNAELARRLLSPLANVELARATVKLGKTLREQSIDLSRESFAVFVPARAPPSGYGLLVFIPPWQKSAWPSGWAPVLERHGMILISAARSRYTGRAGAYLAVIRLWCISVPITATWTAVLEGVDSGRSSMYGIDPSDQ
jgi:hypothetical protein